MADQNKVEQLKGMIEADPNDFRVHYGLGVEYLKIKDAGAAVNAFRRVTELKGDHAPAYRELGKAYEQLNMPEAAMNAYQKGIDVARVTHEAALGREMEDAMKRLVGRREGTS